MTRAAYELLRPVSGEVEGVPVQRLFDPLQPLVLDHAAMRWLEGLRPVGRPGIRCVARARRLADGGYFVVLGEERDAPALKVYSSVRLLLDTSDRLPPRWRLAGNGLVIDPDVSARSLVVCVFEEMGALCHSVETLTRGLELLTLDAGARYVIVDGGVAGDLGAFARLVSRRRPEVVLVGHGDPLGVECLHDAGFSRCIVKPWSVSDFLDLLVGERGIRRTTRQQSSALNGTEEEETWRTILT
jgi:hypothetical protein